jgi:hypothetical protein
MDLVFASFKMRTPSKCFTPEKITKAKASEEAFNVKRAMLFGTPQDVEDVDPAIIVHRLLFSLGSLLQ